MFPQPRRGYSVALLCRATGINRSTYYSWPAAAERQLAKDELTEEIREIHASSRGAYGAPRVHAALRRKGYAINRKKVERIMRERDIRGVTRRRRRHLTQQDTKAAPAPDLVHRATSPPPGRARSSSATSPICRRSRAGGISRPSST
ncbi:IS3 family transposase [Streptomyces sp. NPDC056231]|uniref:IS3 family transposase n=1 Tax=Streptomyces sp. NPDC056231 TaxID=3345755 RepID=UPI003AAC5C74